MAIDFGRIAASQKALTAHPAFMGSDPVSTYSPGAARQDAVLSQRNAGHHAEAYGGREAIDWVYDSIGLYADPAGTAPYVLTKDDGTKLVEKKVKGTPPDHQIGPRDLYDLLNKPNPFMLYDELLSLLVIDLLLVGNGYWMKWRTTSDGKPLALYRLSPAYVKVVPGPFGPKRYEYQPPGARKPLKIDPEQLIHFRRPNPHDAYYGMGVIQGAGRAMDLEIALTDTISSYYENKADPSLIIESERRVPRDIFTKLRAQLRARVSGSHRAGEMLLLENGLKASSLSRSAADSLFYELTKMSRDRIFTKFRASPMLFGLMDETSGSNKVSDVRREFDNYALRPFLARLSSQITDALTAAWGIEFAIEHRTMLPPDEASKIGGEIAKIPGIKVRELRRQYSQFGIEESTGDPDIDEMVLNLPTLEADANGQVTLPSGRKVNANLIGSDQPLPGEPGRPPKPGNTRAITSSSASKQGAKVAQGKALTLDEVERILEQKALNSAGESVSVGNQLPGEVRPDDPFARARKTDIDSLTNTIAAGLRDAAVQLERDLLDHVEGKALKTSDLVGRIQKSKAWTTFKESITQVLEDGARAAAQSGVMHSGRTPDEEIDYDAIVKSVVHRPDGVRGIMKTIKDRVLNRIKEARDGDAERHDYEAAVRAVIAEWSESQAVTIADSEATETYNEAVLTTLEASGESDVYVEDGDEHDEPCKDANGQTWPIAFARQHRKEHPRCRRAFLSIADAAEAGVV